MNLVPNEREKKAIFAELKTEYLYILIPFILLISVKLYISDWREIILSAEWSLASCIIFGQIASKVSMAVSNTNLSVREHNFGWYSAKRFLFVIISMIMYFGMLTKPSLELGWAQIFLFAFASFFHFKDGYAAKLIRSQS